MDLPEPVKMKEVPSRMLRMKPKPKKIPIFVALHLGAGKHSTTKLEAYKVLCRKAILQALAILRKGGSAGEAVVAATVILEDSEIVNAGKGSNLSLDRTVECDAGFMTGNGTFGGVGAVPGVPNPILVAKKLVDLQNEESLLSCGRVPPNFMVGTSVKTWAESQGIPVCEDEKLISRKASKTYEKYIKRVKSLDDNHISDTVGVVALDHLGNVAASVSSGGNWLKFPGRVGHSPQFGCGCWAFQGINDSSQPSRNEASSIAISTSGSGEMLSKTRLPFECAGAIQDGTYFSVGETLSSIIKSKFINADILRRHQEPKYLGIIALNWDGCRGEFVWAHTSHNFVIAYGGSSIKNVKINFTTLPQGSVPGESVNVQAVVF